MPGGDWGQDVPVTGRGAPGVLIAVPSRLAPASQPASQLSLPRLAVLTPRRSSRISATGPGTMRGRRAPGGCGRAEAFAALQSCAPDGGGAARPSRARSGPPCSVRQWEPLQCLGRRLRGAGPRDARGKPGSDWAA